MASRNRGKTKPKLRDLSKEHPTDEEAKAVDEAFLNGAPLVTAILGASEVELRLEQALRRKLQIDDDSIWEKLTGITGPLQTFNQKILLGEALKIYNSDTAANINIIRSIRNVFAHAKKLIDFENELIINVLRTVRIPARKRAKDYASLLEIRNVQAGDGKQCFCMLVYMIDIYLLNRQIRIDKVKASRHLKRTKKVLGIYDGYNNWLLSPHLIKKGLLAPTSILSEASQTYYPTDIARAPGPLRSGGPESFGLDNVDKPD
jgi:hypothetical protein